MPDIECQTQQTSHMIRPCITELPYALRTMACDDVSDGFHAMQVDAFRADADRALGESDQVFKQRVARAPVPTSA